MNHLNKIEWASVGAVRPLWVDAFAQKCSLESATTWQTIPTVGLVALEQVQEFERGYRKHSVKLSFTLKDCYSLLPLQRCVFRLTDTAGRQWLLGFKGAPLPLCLVSDTRSDNLSDRSARFATVTAEIPLLQIL